MMFTGSIAIPGATFTRSNSEGTLGGNQETVSDSRGAYEFPRLVPGACTVRSIVKHSEMCQVRPRSHTIRGSSGRDSSGDRTHDLVP